MIHMANSTADGSVVIEVDMNVSDAEKELARLKTRVFKLEDEIGEKESRRNDLVERRRQLTAEINELQKGRKLLDGASYADTSAIDEKISHMRGEVSTINKEIGSLDRSLDGLNSTLEFAKMRFGEVSEIAKTLTKEFDESTISGRLEKASYELAQLSAQGKGLGNQEYDAAYRKLALLTEEARAYQKELTKTPEQARREADAIRAAQEAEQRLLDIKENAAVSDQHMIDLNEELVRLKARQAELQRAGVGLGHQEYDGILQRLREINVEIKGYEDGLLQVEKNTGNAVRKTDAAQKTMSRLGKRIRGLAASALVFNVISRALTSLQQMVMKYVKTNDKARQAIAQMKGALLTLAQPLIEVIIPAFVMLVNILTKVINAVAAVLSKLFGKSHEQSKDNAQALYEEQKALEGTGEAAEEAAGSLAGFDEINQIDTSDRTGGGGGSDIAPDFTPIGDDGLLDKLKEIAGLVLLIGTGFALWKLGDLLPGVLGEIASKLGGILIAVGGLLLFWDGLSDAWENGIDWGNLIEMMGGLAAAAFGLYTAFGPAAAGIALVVGGLAMLVTGFRDAMNNGWNLENLLTSIGGILATGLGISLLAGSFIPLLISGIAALLLAFTVATGHGEELLSGIKTMLEGFKDFFVGIFTGDIEKALGGITKIFQGLKTAVFAVIDGIKDTFLGFLDWLDEKTGGKLHGIIEFVKGLFSGGFDWIKTVLGNLIDAVEQIFGGIVQFIAGVFTGDWDKAWEGVKNIFKGVWNGIVSLLEGAVNLIIKGINWMISQLNKISFTFPDWVPFIGGNHFGINIPAIPEAQIPRLAKGAVIPANREFLAVLGDQKSGNNLEAPEDLIRKIVREEAGSNGETAALLQAILSAIKNGHVIMVDGSVFGRTAIKTINMVNTAAGKQLLKI